MECKDAAKACEWDPERKEWRSKKRSAERTRRGPAEITRSLTTWFAHYLLFFIFWYFFKWTPNIRANILVMAIQQTRSPVHFHHLHVVRPLQRERALNAGRSVTFFELQTRSCVAHSKVPPQRQPIMLIKTYIKIWHEQLHIGCLLYTINTCT